MAEFERLRLLIAELWKQLDVPTEDIAAFLSYAASTRAFSLALSLNAVVFCARFVPSCARVRRLSGP